jgi:uncharacterized membrane protein YqgA involved in biofilm formation
MVSIVQFQGILFQHLLLLVAAKVRHRTGMVLMEVLVVVLLFMGLEEVQQLVKDIMVERNMSVVIGEWVQAEALLL